MFALPLLQRLSGMSLQVADSWFTECTYARVAPPELGCVSFTDPVFQFLQTMPCGPVATALEGRMQRLLLLSTADSALLLMQWSESRSSASTGSGNLVLLDQIQLPSPVLQFLRQQPEETLDSDLAQDAQLRRRSRLFRAFPWEVDLLVQPVAHTQTPDSDASSNEQLSLSGSTTACSSEGERQQAGKGPPLVKKTRAIGAGSLARDFATYGVAIVLRNSCRVLRSLDPRTLQRVQCEETAEGQVLAIAPLPSLSGLLAFLVSSQPRVHRSSSPHP